MASPGWKRYQAWAQREAIRQRTVAEQEAALLAARDEAKTVSQHPRKEHRRKQRQHG